MPACVSDTKQQTWNSFELFKWPQSHGGAGQVLITERAGCMLPGSPESGNKGMVEYKLGRNILIVNNNHFTKLN